MQFWPAIETLPGLAAVKAEWQALVGAEFQFVDSLLRPRATVASSFPRLGEYGGLPFRVVDHGDGKFVGVCHENGDRVNLVKADLIVYELDQSALARRIAQALGIEPPIVPEGDRSPSRLLGLFDAAIGVQRKAFTAIPHERDDLGRAAAELIGHGHAPFLLAAPTRRFLRETTETMLRSNGCAFLALADVLEIGSNQAFLPVRAGVRSLAVRDVTPVGDEPLSERAQAILIALLESQAFDADRLMTIQEIAVKAFGPTADGNSIKGVISELAGRKLLATQRGRGGGCWLTESGRLRAEKLKLAVS